MSHLTLFHHVAQMFWNSYQCVFIVKSTYHSASIFCSENETHQSSQEAEYLEGNTSCLLHHSSFQNTVQKAPWFLLAFNINSISSRVQVSWLWWLPHHVWPQLRLSGNTFALKTSMCLCYRLRLHVWAVGHVHICHLETLTCVSSCGDELLNLNVILHGKTSQQPK